MRPPGVAAPPGGHAARVSPLALRPVAPHRAASRRALLAGSAGNLVEWYEFGVYGCFATVIATHFFTPPAGTAGGAPALIATYASFALAFFFRRWGRCCSGVWATVSAGGPSWCSWWA